MTKLEFVSLLLYLNKNTQSTPTAIYTLEKKIVPSVKTFISKKEENITTATTLVI